MASPLKTVLLWWALLVSLEVGGSQIPEAVDLSSFTLDKMVGKFPLSLILFTRSYPYGPELEAFRSVARKLVHAEDVLVGLVEVKDYGVDRENRDLAERFGLLEEDVASISGQGSSEKPPVPVLFISREQHFRFRGKAPSGTFTAEELEDFVRDKSGNRALATGFIPELDSLVQDLLQEFQDKGQVGQSMAKAEAILEASKASKASKVAFKKTPLSLDKAKMAQFYLALMRKVVKEGKGFLVKEVERLEKVYASGSKDSDKSKKTKEEVKATKVAIVQSFLSHCPDCQVKSLRNDGEL